MELIKLESYNIWGQKINEGIIHFDFNKEIIFTQDGKEIKVIKDSEFTYKIQKTQIKAIGGIVGFIDFLKEINDPSSPFNPSLTELFIALFSNADNKGNINFGDTLKNIN